MLEDISEMARLNPGVQCVCWVRSLEKQPCVFVLLAHSLQIRGSISSPEFVGLSFSILVCCVSAYGTLKLALKAGITHRNHVSEKREVTGEFIYLYTQHTALFTAFENSAPTCRIQWSELVHELSLYFRVLTSYWEIHPLRKSGAPQAETGAEGKRKRLLYHPEHHDKSWDSWHL